MGFTNRLQIYHVGFNLQNNVKAFRLGTNSLNLGKDFGS